MTNLHLTVACWDYDRTRALRDGRVRPAGIDLTYLPLPVEETFFRMLRHREFDVSEMSLSSYVLSLFTPERPFVGIPVFTSRMFRHSCIYVNADSGIASAADLAGRRVGVPEYQMTAGVWIRGILAEHEGVPVDSVTYYTGGLEQPDRPEKLPIDPPSRIRIVRIGPEQTLSSMLAAGEIDALYTARTPSSFSPDAGRVVRLFPNFGSAERAYFQRTRIFPIMHTVVIRRDVYERAPWVAQSLHEAFAAAQRDAYQELAETAALKVMIPWLPAQLVEIRREMGEDYWPYGLDRNRATLATFLRYSHEQGLSRDLLAPDDLFAAETRESFRI